MRSLPAAQDHNEFLRVAAIAGILFEVSLALVPVPLYAAGRSHRSAMSRHQSSANHGAHSQRGSASSARTAAPSPLGIWQGTLEISAIELRLVFHVNKGQGGALTGTLDSPDQGATGIPLSQVTFQKGALHLESAAIQGSYDGTMNRQGTALTGKWHQGGVTFPLNLKHVKVALTARHIQEPEPPFPYDTPTVEFRNETAGITLAGTLSVPRSDGPFPAVVLVAGSGPNNRDENVLGHRIFLVLADYLTRRGLAVLRYDKRGVGHSTGSYATATTADFASDAQAAVEFLKQQPEIDPHHIGIIGHSEGGVIAPIVASRTDDVAFIVLMAGTGVPGSDILLTQSALIGRAIGESEASIARSRSFNEKAFTVVEQEPDSQKARRKLEALWNDLKSHLSTAEQRQLKQADSAGVMMQAQLKELTGPWFRYFLTYDPATALKQVKCPVLAINGSRDLQVSPTQNLPVIEAALKAGGNTDATVKVLPGLNHLFQESKTGSPAEYARLDQTISPTALQVMGDWIAAHTGAH